MDIQRAIDVMKQRKKCEFCQLADDTEACFDSEECLKIPYEDLRDGYIFAILALEEKLEREGNKVLGNIKHPKDCVYLDFMKNGAR